MSHNDNLVSGLQKLLKSLGLHTGLYSGGLFLCLGLTTEIGNVFIGFNHRLVASAAKGHIHGGSCKFIVLNIGFGTVPKSYT